MSVMKYSWRGTRERERRGNGTDLNTCLILTIQENRAEWERHYDGFSEVTSRRRLTYPFLHVIVQHSASRLTRSKPNEIAPVFLLVFFP